MQEKYLIGKRLDKKDKIKYITSQTSKQTIKIPILPNMSRSKDNQSMQFPHLMDIIYMKNIFIEKIFAKYGSDVLGRPV